MGKYQKPDMSCLITDVREEIQRDFKTLEQKYSLPLNLSFDSVCIATKQGMAPGKDYPFRKLQRIFTDYLSNQKIPKEDFLQAIDIFVAVWNYFPHDDLGMSPIEKIREEHALYPNDVSQSEMKEEVFNKMCENILSERILFLSHITHDILAIHLKKIGCVKKDAEEIIRILEDPKGDASNALSSLLTMIIARHHGKGKIKPFYIGETQPAVRALCACEWHTASKMPNGQYNSRMFSEIVQQVISTNAESTNERAPKNPIDPIVPFELLIKTHQAIEERCRQLRVYTELSEAAHHILDWLVATNMQEILKMPPKDTALIMLATSHLISKTANPKYPLGCSAKKIRIACASIYNYDIEYNKEISRCAELALCSSGDPLLMLANVINPPDDAILRLMKIAPCLSSKNQSNGPTPSPYF